MTTKVLNYRDIIFFSERPFITEAIAKQPVGMEEATRKKNTPKKKGRIMYQLKVDVDKLNAVKVVLNWRFER